MINAIRSFFLRIGMFLLHHIVSPILYIAAAFRAKKEYKKIFQDTSEMCREYLRIKQLFFKDGGYDANKDAIEMRSKALKQNADTLEDSLTRLNNMWGQFFNEKSKATMENELAAIKEIREFGMENCQNEGT